MPAGHEDGEHGGMDALMAAITGTPLPPRAQRDPALLAEHRSAEADVAVLREQLVRLAEVLTGEPQQPAPEATPGAGAGATAADGPVGAGAGGGAGGAGAEGAQRVGTEDAEGVESEGAGGVGRSAADGSAGGGAGGVGGGAEGTGMEGADGAGTEVTSGPVPGAAPAGLRGAGRPRSVRRPGGAGRPGRPGGVRRGARVVLGSVAGVMAFGLVAVLGWAVVHSGGGMSAGSDKSADAKSRADGPARAAGGPALSCYRLLAEGTVTRVDRKTRAPRIRVVLTVTRSYRPAHGPSEVTFLLGDTASPTPRSGQHVLAGVGRGRQEASLWAVGDARVADERARLTGTAPESAPAPCDEP
ncbi:hypothetical protein [Streptomyces sp. NPDC052292]|uniref:hypothetical protein n=1 Tax=Streptomyces sp. NPDC052292 TaxID=3155053 RepID=UPI0034487125